MAGEIDRDYVDDDEYGSAATFGPARLWLWSCRLYRTGHPRLAQLLKLLNYVLFRAILPPQCEVADDVRLPHRGLGVVLHPNTTIGRGVRIYHHVTVASNAPHGATSGGTWVVIGDDVEIGVGAVLVNQQGQTLVIGDGSVVGANATVARDVPPGHTVVSAATRTFPRVSRARA